MHPSTDPEIITKALTEKDHEVTIYVNKHRVTKVNLTLWFIDLKPNKTTKKFITLKN